MNARQRRTDKRMRSLKKQIRFIHRPAWQACTNDYERSVWMRRYGALSSVMPEIRAYREGRS